MVLAESGRPAVGVVDESLPLLYYALHFRQGPGLHLVFVCLAASQVDDVELEDHVELLVARAYVSQDMGGVWGVGELADGHGVVFGEDGGVHLAEEFVHARAVAEEATGGLFVDAAVDYGCVGVFCAFRVHVYCIDSEAVDPLLEPEFHGRVVECASGGGVLPIEIGLLFCEEVEVVFLCLLVPFPCASAEDRAPVVRWHVCAICGVFRRSPDVPISLRVVF